MQQTEVIIFCLYFIFMLLIGVYFFIKDKNGDEKTYFIGGRKMGPWVTALSAGASDMSAWVLMGLPTSVYAFGLGQLWIAIGLALGYALSWIIEAPRLRKFSIVSNDSITIPQYITNRFKSKSRALQVICAIVFLFAYTIYAASSIKACGTLFNKVMKISELNAMYLATFIIVGYTFLGGFSAVCWTDFFQGLLILGAMLLAPIFAITVLDTSEIKMPVDFWNMFKNWKDVISGLAWGLGYFGMPHIIIRFMSLKSQKDLKKSAVIGISWTFLILLFATLIGIIGRIKFGFNEEIVAGELVFISIVRKIFPSVMCGVLLSAVLAASMSTADSQLLAASSAFTSDVYHSVIRKEKASDKEMLWVGRLIVLLVSFIAFFIAKNPNSGSIMSLVSNAWSVFGAAFSPVILLSLFWKRFNFAGAFAGILIGAFADIIWMIFLSHTGIYELAPGFIIGFIAAVITSLATKEPNRKVEELFDRAINYRE